MEVIKVNDLSITLVRKKIKNINLRIKSGGEVYVSAPLGAQNQRIISFITSKYSWIKSHLDCVKPKPDFSFVKDGKITIFGEVYPFVFKNGSKNLLTVGETVTLTLKNGLDEQKVLSKLLKEKLLEVVTEKLSYRVRRTGLVPSAVAVRDMKTRWGTCNVKTKKITLSLQLVKKPIVCIDYVITHELGHIINRYHDKRFYNYMDNNFPTWREVKKLLNGY